MLEIMSAIWLGILTSISPCPLATNIAAISYISKRFSRPRQVFMTGLLYTLGRMLAYAGLAVILVSLALSVPAVSFFLQNQMNKLLAPILVLVGMILLELIRIDFPSTGLGARLQSFADSHGIWAAAPLGLIFALSFCPVSAALFFGSLLPLAAKWNSSVGLPALYGLGTGLPVLGFSLVMAFGLKRLGTAFDSLTRFEWWARRITGVVFICVGVYLSSKYIFHLL
ncbi:MAG: aromatic aminobenezylarsenical efflux permease ArsG family transporter [Elusimicrobiota bacterium]